MYMCMYTCMYYLFWKLNSTFKKWASHFLSFSRLSLVDITISPTSPSCPAEEKELQLLSVLVYPLSGRQTNKEVTKRKILGEGRAVSSFMGTTLGLENTVLDKKACLPGEVAITGGHLPQASPAAGMVKAVGPSRKAEGFLGCVLQNQVQSWRFSWKYLTQKCSHSTP